MNSKPYVSRYLRKENFESLNHPSPQPFSPHHATTHQDLSAQKRTLQQRQIEDLEQKVDIILQHNEKLAQENTELKRRLADYEVQGLATVQKERMSRYQIEDTENTLRRVRAELQIKARQCEVLACECEAAREAAKREAEGLRVVIANLTASLDQAKLEALRAQQEAGQVREQAEGDRRLALKDQERRLQEEFLRAQRAWNEEAARQKAQQERAAEEAVARFEAQRAEWATRKNALVSKLQETHNREIGQLREEIGQQFQLQLAKLAEEAGERCRNEREKAQRFIKESLQGVGAEGQAETEALKRQIQALQTSLQNRRQLIQQLTANQLEREEERQGLSQVLLLRRRLKEQVESLLRENQSLKIASAEQHQRELGETVRVYQDRLEVLCSQIRWLQEQNGRLRANFQAQVRGKIQQRRAWEVEAGQLRNLVRKLKVQLRGIEEEFKLNIEGIRDQNTTFSMTIMKSMIQDRDKASFFEEENRKLRALYNRHESEVEQEKLQAQERIAFYQNKYDQLKKSMEGHRKDLAQKEQLLQAKLDERQRAISEANRAERQELEALITQWQAQKEQVEAQLEEERGKAETLAAEAKEAREEAEGLRSKLKENEEHIQRLRMQLQMAGVDDGDKNEAVNHWREHYEGIILKLQGDKQQLNSILDANNAKIQQLIYRYRTLEGELHKATASLQQRSELDSKVVELGMDQNLIKNMAEIWGKRSQ